MSEYGVILFHTTSSAMKAEKILKQGGFEVKLIPTPRQFSSDCGISLRFTWEQAGAVRMLMEAAGAEVDAVHPL
ncbi:MAG: DUF3343 domain-containing protein [Chloroflexi bacterium]|nr:DUF3343 domain-containing protein [Chloroflexota bacterium]